MTTTSHTPGRNDPCPCGSGRKYKLCCLAARQARDAARLRWRTTEGGVVAALLEFALELCGQDFFLEGWDEFFNWEHVPEDLENTPEFESMFLHWFVFSFVADPHLPDRPPHWPAEPIGRHFLWERGSTLPEDDRRFIDRACSSPLSAGAGATLGRLARRARARTQQQDAAPGGQDHGRARATRGAPVGVRVAQRGVAARSARRRGSPAAEAETSRPAPA